MKCDRRRAEQSVLGFDKTFIDNRISYYRNYRFHSLSLATYSWANRATFITSTMHAFYLRTTRRIISGSDSRTSHNSGNTSSIICVKQYEDNRWQTIAFHSFQSPLYGKYKRAKSRRQGLGECVDGDSGGGCATKKVKAFNCTCDLSSLSNVRSIHCSTLATILKSL